MDFKFNIESFKVYIREMSCPNRKEIVPRCYVTDIGASKVFEFKHEGCFLSMHEDLVKKTSGKNGYTVTLVFDPKEICNVGFHMMIHFDLNKSRIVGNVPGNGTFKITFIEQPHIKCIEWSDPTFIISATKLEEIYKSELKKHFSSKLIKEYTTH